MVDVKEVWKHKVGGGVQALAFSLDGSAIAVASADGTLHLMGRDGKFAWSQQMGSPIAAVDMSSAGDFIAAGLKSGTVQLLDRTGKTVWRHEAGSEVLGVSLSRNGRYVVAGTSGGSIIFLDNRGQPVWSRNAKGPVPGVAVSSSANYAAAGSEDGSIYFIDNYSTNMGGKVLWTLPTRGKVRELCLSTDGFYAAAASSDSTVHYLDKLGKLYWSNKVENAPAALAMSASGDIVAVGIEGGAHPGQVSLFHRNEGLLWRYITGDATVGAIDISTNGAFIAAGSQNGEVYLFHRAQKLLWKQSVEGWVDAVAVTPDGNFTVAGTRQGAVYLYDNRAAVEEFRPKTREEAELELSLFRPMRTAAPPEPAEEAGATTAAREIAAEAEERSISALEIVVDVCLLAVLGLLALVYYFIIIKTISQDLGLIMLFLLLFVMASLLLLFYKYVLRKPGKSKGKSFY
jgi:WD40 repeat protein